MNAAVWLSSDHRQYLLAEYDQNRAVLTFPEDRPSCPSALSRNIRKALRIRTELSVISFPEQGSLTIEDHHFFVELDARNRLTAARVSVHNEIITVEQLNELSPAEARFFARNGELIPSAAPDAEQYCRTDLHTHFAGCLRTPDLIRIGLEQKITYPPFLLEEAGICGFTEPVLLNELPLPMRSVLEQQLEIPLDRQITFVELEKIYRLRSPITKPLPCFIPILEQIALDYQAMGVLYAEISFTDIVNSERIALLNRHLPAIEEKMGTVIRFLGAMGRTDDFEWDLDYIERLKELRSSPWITGVDFLGHELNSTSAIVPQIRLIAEWAHRENPDYVIRIHAGENPAHPENIRIALEAVRGKKVSVRIGHGLYGADERTVELLKETSAVVECNFNSNYALNNIVGFAGLPLTFYAEQGIRTVLGTDGYGIYQTSVLHEIKAAVLAGADTAVLKEIKNTEEQILRKVKPLPPHLPEFPPMRNVHCSESAAENKRQLQRAADERFVREISAKGITLLDRESAEKIMENRKCISFAGSWKTVWDQTLPEDQAAVRKVIEDLLSRIDPNEYTLITGGTHFGVESVVHEYGSARNFTILGMVVADLDPSFIDERITYAFCAALQFYGKAAVLYRMIQRVNGWALFFGGGDVTADEIQTAHNLKLNYLLMDGAGASAKYCRIAPQHGFTRADEIAEALRGSVKWISSEGSYWYLGMNPTVDAVIFRCTPVSAKREVLLIRRRIDALTEAGKWALPGGFVHTDAPVGSLWQAGAESLESACLRELCEETSLDLRGEENRLIHLFDVDRVGRDPRDTPERWSRNSVFSLELSGEQAKLPICGNDDAELAVWCEIDDLPWNTAFDHREIIERAVSMIYSNDSSIF